jgi:hypothetical protein
MICHDAIATRDAAIGSRPRMRGVRLRRHIGWFLPVALFALMLQILAPIGASSIAVAALADPLQGTEICHGAAQSESGSSDRDTGHHAAIDCLSCCLLHAGGALDTPASPFARVPPRLITQFVWRGSPLNLLHVRTSASARARAPPTLS